MSVRSFSIAAIFTLWFGGSAAAGSDLPRAWVSGLGTDAATCGSLPSPCRTLQYAVENIVEAGGSVYVKDPATYGKVTISKSISIVNEGPGLAIIQAAAGNGVTVGSGSGVAVVLQGLLIDGGGNGVNGISTTDGGSLTVLNCTIKGFTGSGISIAPGFAGNVTVADSTIANNGTGIYTSGDGSGSLTVSLSHDQIIDNGFGSGGYGVRVTGGSAAYQFTTIEASHIAQNGVGLSVEANGSNVVQASLFDVRLVDNAKSINVAGGAALRLEKTSVQSSFFAAITNAGSIVSFGDNAITDSVSGTAITTTPLK